nr:immunoglobulin light chain junction region [Macaca mulatta]MOX79760.1 immunoglobulin light chain junction region [Macaca mulatta]MOX81075.1 immunoglobulin light chain junction region [Macaca mulatta]MOX81871.1 immunoglobulin light chain junction region [Macaca mulatta]MOX82342.1 immunoglobulin light chain junction region [Macaca mulatta]
DYWCMIWRNNVYIF